MNMELLNDTAVMTPLIGGLVLVAFGLITYFKIFPPSYYFKLNGVYQKCRLKKSAECENSNEYVLNTVIRYKGIKRFERIDCFVQLEDAIEKKESIYEEEFGHYNKIRKFFTPIKLDTK